MIAIARKMMSPGHKNTYENPFMGQPRSYSDILFIWIQVAAHLFRSESQCQNEQAGGNLGHSTALHFIPVNHSLIFLYPFRFFYKGLQGFNSVTYNVIGRNYASDETRNRKRLLK